MKRFLSLCAIVATYVLCCSHELFFKADSYFLSPNTQATLFLFNGTFDKSENTIERDRISDTQLLGPNFKLALKEDMFYDINQTTYLRFSVGDVGTYAGGISTKPRMISMDGQAFQDYLEHEGLEDTMAERMATGTQDVAVKEKYAKHVKTLLQVGDKNTPEFGAYFGFPIEFVAKTNPYTVGKGEAVSFQLLSAGKPLANHICHYSTSMPGLDAHDHERSARTDANGIIKIFPDRSGQWYIATIHMEKSAEDGVDYESNWATLTFAIR